MASIKFGHSVPRSADYDPGRCVIELTHTLEPAFIAHLRPFLEIELLRGTRVVRPGHIIYTFHTTDEKIAVLRRAFVDCFIRQVPPLSDN